jgi:beta-1,4-galactosyltransferase 1
MKASNFFVNKNTSDNSIDFSSMRMGGLWKPTSCVARQRLAVIILYRDRENHPNVLLNVLHLVLQRQLLDYAIFVMEQVNGVK